MKNSSGTLHCFHFYKAERANMSTEIQALKDPTELFYSSKICLGHTTDLHALYQDVTLEDFCILPTNNSIAI